MKDFIIIGHKAVTETFSLNDLPGAAGRMDILCRCVNAALFLSHDLRRDVRVFLIHKGDSSPKLVCFEGSAVRYLSPDERSAASLIKKALEKNIQDFWTESTPGVSVRKGDLEGLLKELDKKIIYLREDGEDVRKKKIDEDFDPLFLLGDHLGLTGEEERIVMGYDPEIMSIGPLSLHADHCIVLLHNEMDRNIFRTTRIM